MTEQPFCVFKKDTIYKISGINKTSNTTSHIHISARNCKTILKKNVTNHMKSNIQHVSNFITITAMYKMYRWRIQWSEEKTCHLYIRFFCLFLFFFNQPFFVNRKSCNLIISITRRNSLNDDGFVFKQSFSF